MLVSSFALLMLSLCLPAHASVVLAPDDFEQIWVLDNQRNLIQRYRQRTELFQLDKKPLYSLDIDATANQTIKTSAGDKTAILDRMGIHYQDPNYLLVIDWLSLIPQPQTTEGFTYGDTVLGYSWEPSNDLSLTLGGRLQSRPKTTLWGGETVFNLSDNATLDRLGGFVHINYSGWDFGSYYSNADGNQATSLYVPLHESETQHLATALTYLGGAPDLNISSRYELSLDYRSRFSQHQLNGGLTIASLSDNGTTALSNAYLLYQTPAIHSIRYSGGLFHTYNLDSHESLPGAKLGAEYVFQLEGELTMGLFIRQNAFGDINAMVVKNEPVFSFTIYARPQF